MPLDQPVFGFCAYIQKTPLQGSPETSEGREGEKHRPTTRALLMLEGQRSPRALGDTTGGVGHVLGRSDC